MKTAFGFDVTQENLDHVKEWVQSVVFEKTVWTPRHALLRSDGAVVEYIGQDYDAAVFKWLENGWTEDRCEFCERTIKNGDSGRTPDGRNWLCVTCYVFLNDDSALVSENGHADHE